MKNIGDINEIHKSLAEIRQILAESNDDSLTMGDVFIKSLRGELSIFSTRFESLLRLFMKDKEFFQTVERWYELDYDFKTIISQLIYPYRDLINIGEEPRSENKADAFDKACRITENYMSLIEKLTFIESITDEICVVLPFINPSVYQDNVNTQNCIRDFPDYKKMWEDLHDQIDFFKSEALKVKPASEITHANLTVVKHDKEDGIANLTDDDFLFEGMRNFVPAECYEVSEEDDETPLVETTKILSIQDLQNLSEQEQSGEDDE
ncbi:hypothetical protein [Vibrio sp. 1CM23M]|uniref:hypothetical protein n=1 Tax=Vibrio sp. 1CM23M TaxID=2929164 RepID=UPI0020BD899E|nr:hypothetical protein [Vibrio sp. 1CM23M]MCK8072440.1 hypothetical protein [Vibrio sp. 1CM23M]